MKNKNPKKLLVLIDGSDRSINTVRYVAKNVSFHGMQIVIFHAFSAVPESYWDLENDLRSKKVIKQARAWEISQKRLIDNYMTQAKQLLVKSGIPEKSINTKVKNRKAGIARDIIDEAKNGYTAVIARRRGAGALRGMVLGSVATKLTEKLVFLPLILVGKKPPGDKVLIGFDGSQGAMKAVDFVASIYGGLNYQVELLHVIRGDEPGLPSTASVEEYSQEIINNVTPAFDIAVNKLIKSGFRSGSVSIKFKKRKISRSKTIVDEARKNNFGTIVMGRKGWSRTRNFFIGRVTNKVIHLARDRSVWIIR